MSAIVLTTLNARYSHTALGLRCLQANLKELKNDSQILEFVIGENVQDMAERILTCKPHIVGIGAYIWNAAEVALLTRLLKTIAPECTVVLGGPEASHLPHRVNFDAADYIISGEGEVAFYELCRDLLLGSAPGNRFFQAAAPELKSVTLPYACYSDHDIANRYVYVEASRGCPFLCEFCLSAIDEKVRHFGIERFLEALETLWERGARDFKFIDRTFNINMRLANAVLDFFLSRTPPYFAHFEVIPDHFPDALKAKLRRFPPGSLQLEVGIQTLDAEVAERISRPLKMDKIRENLRFLQEETRAHLHLDLIVGLPGESIEGFGRNLDALCALSASEIQVGILKKLSGTPLGRHDAAFDMRYSDMPPYDLLQNDRIDFMQMQRMKRFARFWDLYYNSGNFTATLPLLFEAGSVFERFYDFSLWIYAQTRSTWKISLERLGELLFEYLLHVRNLAETVVAKALVDDLLKLKGRALPSFLRPWVQEKVKQMASVPGKQKRQLKRN